MGVEEGTDSFAGRPLLEQEDAEGTQLTSGSRAEGAQPATRSQQGAEEGLQLLHRRDGFENAGALEDGMMHNSDTSPVNLNANPPNSFREGECPVVTSRFIGDGADDVAQGSLDPEGSSTTYGGEHTLMRGSGSNSQHGERNSSHRSAAQPQPSSPGMHRGSGGGGVAIELSEFGAASSRLDGDEPLLGVGDDPSARGSGDRHCFICLQEGDKDTPLVRCCSTCFASTHVRCWHDWRNNQRLTALRSRLLGLNSQNNNLLRCTICKSGTAMLAGEEGRLQWMNELLCGNEQGRDARTPVLGGQLRQDNSDDDNDAPLDDLVDTKTCLALLLFLAVLVLVLLVACFLIVTERFYAGDVVMCCIVVLYELSVLQIVALHVARRRGGMLETAAGSGAGEGGGGGSGGGATGRHLVGWAAA
mmetsp:Transcript_66999/g.173724  ORF Transcript_66999/g.173724 Transcript_66999/m.173724 type:complete len:417 (-) Transcript_66999:238-1488(-)